MFASKMNRTKSEINKKYNSTKKGQATQRKWREENKEELKLKKKAYYQLNKERAKKYREDHRKTIQIRMVAWRKKNRERISKYNNSYSKTEVGRANIKKRDIKKRKRRAGELGFHPISFPLNVSFEWHHVNKNDVVAIPRVIHRSVSHICGDGKLEGVVG